MYDKTERETDALHTGATLSMKRLAAALRLNPHNTLALPPLSTVNV